MAATDLSITAAMVIVHLPIDASQITASTHPLSTTDIEVFIQDGTSEMAGIIGKDGAVLGDLEDDALVQVKAAIKAYAVAESLDAIGARGADYDKWRRKYQDIRDRFADRPALVAYSKNRVFSNVQERQVGSDFNDPDYRF